MWRYLQLSPFARGAETDLRAAASRQDAFRTFQRASQVLLSFQSAASVVLVIVALLLSVSLHRLTSQEIGLRPSSLVATLSASPGLAN